MNSRQLQYAVLLSRERNFSLVAKKLNITQPALSKQILNLEAEIGIKLFDRNTVPLELTAAGKHFIREAKELLYKEEQLLKSMDYYKSGVAGDLVIGITPFRCSYMIADVIKKIRDKYPKITVRLNELGSNALRKEVAEGRFDFAIVNLPVDDSVLDVTPLEADRLVLVLTDGMAKNLSKNGVDFKDCSALPFVAAGIGQEMRTLLDRLCAAAGFTPVIAAEVVGLTTAWTVACAGVGATILPWQFVKGRENSGMTFIEINDEIYTRQPAIVTRRGQYISEAASYAIKLLAQK